VPVALGVEVVIGDALDPQAVAQACRLADRDARVVSTLGSFRQSAPVDYQGNRHVIDEMERAGLSRLLLVTSLGCGDSWQYLPERARAAFGHEVRLKSLAESWLQTSRGLQLLTDQEACGQIYAIGDPGLNQP